MKRVMIAIPTFNRPQVLETTLRSVAKIKNLDQVVVHIFDDCSTEIDWSQLQAKFSFISKVHQNASNTGCDLNTFRALQFFADSEFSHLLILDSDCLVRDDILNFVQEREEKPREIWSLYRSRFHSEYAKCDIADHVYKVSLGALGMFLKREDVQTFLNSAPKINKIDWDIILYFNKLGFNFKTPFYSLVQHTGWSGSHNSFSSPDFAFYFTPTNAEDTQIIERLFRELPKRQSLAGKALTFYRTKWNSLQRYRFRVFLRGLGI